MVTQTITLSMIPGGVTPRIYASQNDHGLRVFVFNLVDENGGYAIPSGTTALLNVLKPDRTVVSETCTWSGSTVTADCTEQMTAVAGNVHCEVRLVAANGDAVGSANFILGVESNPLASGVVSESDFDSISDMVDRAVAAASIPPTYVTDWLDENITQETGYVIDQSLTIENAAADAKAAGDLIRASFVVGEASGSIASFTDGADNIPVKDLIVNITPKQAGTGDPSPTNVRNISGWTEATVTNSGKNLLMENIVGMYPAASSNVFRFGLHPVTLPAGTYTLSWISGTLSPIYWTNATNGYSSTQITTNPQTFTLNSTSEIFIRSASAAPVTWDYVGMQLESGTEATPYVAPDVHNISFSSAGTVYGGTLDVTSGMLTVTHRYIEVTDESNITYNPDERGGRFSFIINEPYIRNYTYSLYSNMFMYNVAPIGSSIVDNTICATASGRGLYWLAHTYTSLAEMKAVFANTPLQVVAELAQPISYQLDPVSIASLLGQNNIWSDTGSIASCEYRADTKLYLEKLTNPDDDMVANANITSGSYFMVGNSLYLATANIANGGAIIPGTNCTETNLAAALNAINS